MDDTFWQILVLATIVLMTILSIVVIGLARQVGAIMLRLGPARAGALEGGPPIGTQVEVPGLGDAPTLLVFVAPGCGLCDELRPALRTVARGYPEIAVQVVVHAQSDTERSQYAARFGDSARQDLGRLYDDWGVPGTPFAVAIDVDRDVVATGVVNTLEHLEAVAEGLVRLREPELVGTASEAP